MQPLKARFARLDELKAKLDELRPLPPDAAARLRQRLDFQATYHSNAIEGNSLDWNETQVFLLHGLTAKGKPIKDHLDLRGHREALQLLEELVKETDALTNYNLKHLHKVLLKEPYEAKAVDSQGNPVRRLIKVGEYKTEPNHVRTATGEMFHCTEPAFVVADMTDLLDWYREEEKKRVEGAADALHPVALAVTLHYRFVRIHPFDDGNGRMARLLMNFCLMRLGFPPAIIPIDDRSAYYRALQAADATGELEELAELVAEAVEKSLELSLRAARGESIDERDDWKQKLKLLEMEYEGIGKPEINRTMDRELMIQRMEDSFIPLVRALDEAAAPFGKFFNDFKSWIGIDYLQSFPTGSFTVEAFLEACDTQGNFRFDEGKISYNALFSELRMMPEINEFVTIQIKIDKYYYVIEAIYLSSFVSEQIPINVKRLHTEPLREDEIKDWASALGKALTEILQQMFEKLKRT